jgi:Tfp pilus assembly protein PilE
MGRYDIEQQNATYRDFDPRGLETVRSTFGMVGLLIVLAIGYLIYSIQIRSVTNDKPLAQQTNLVAVRGQLLSLGQAERLYLATNGSYATLEQLQHSDAMSIFPESNRRIYLYTVEVDGAAHFRITARPADPSRTDFPTLFIDETMQISP